MFDKEHFETIAEVLKAERIGLTDASRLFALNSVVAHLADRFEVESKETFRRGRFYKATGFTNSNR